jgi:hypothetical protein
MGGKVLRRYVHAIRLQEYSTYSYKRTYYLDGFFIVFLKTDNTLNIHTNVATHLGLEFDTIYMEVRLPPQGTSVSFSDPLSRYCQIVPHP